MRWSGLRAIVIDKFAPELRGRLDLYSTRYGNCTCGHAWMTFDGTVIANFCTRAKYIADGYEHGSAKRNNAYAHQFADFGELSRQDAYRACWEFAHEMSIEQAMQDDDPLIQSLAMADGRLGKRRLAQIDTTKLHRLAAHVLELRKAA
ncbi:SF0329 family protein [Sphingomonas immobilis]|uniref:Uncharacterized protein n=1 Tax=Sphingomonas immobilis TaxID=3063997 RepID=A0ABT9A3E5_9SPHN|nr:hypothetical protein [Sphingomonas sp. CA1-15]MDO7843859.1 hypothetical protein [Sphingomonas sp. CA1-15]